jgi:hypothetical protein
MQTTTNIIDALITDAGDNLEVRTNSKFLINALTAQVISSTMSFVARREANMADDGVASLDVRNEQDENARGQEVKDHMTNAAGHDLAMAAYKVADICDSIRYQVYDELAKALGPETPLAKDVLFHSPPKGAKPSYDLPMSVVDMYDFRIKKAAEVSPVAISTIAEDEGEDEEFVRSAMFEAAERDVRKLRTMREDVFSEIESLNGAYNYDSFATLPKETQSRLIAKVLAALTRENKRLFALIVKGVATVKVDGDDVPVTTLRKFVKNSVAKCEEALNTLRTAEE